MDFIVYCVLLCSMRPKKEGKTKAKENRNKSPRESETDKGTWRKNTRSGRGNPE
jgi:hypothetical protein